METKNPASKRGAERRQDSRAVVRDLIGQLYEGE